MKLKQQEIPLSNGFSFVIITFDMSELIITKEQVKRIAHLCKLQLTEAELEKFSQTFTQTLAVIDVLNELDTSDVPETYQVTGLGNVFQEDVEQKGTLTQEEVLKNAKNKKRGLIVTKGVFDR